MTDFSDDKYKYVSYKKYGQWIDGERSVYVLEGLQAMEGYLHEFISYNKFNENEEEIPSDYKASGVSESNIKAYRYDFSKERLNKDNDEYKVISANNIGSDKYYVHDNGGRPFLVYISENSVSIYKRNTDKFYVDPEDFDYKYKTHFNNDWMYIELVGEYNPVRVFIGDDKSKDWGKGNSSLLQLSDYEYIFIGLEIINFNTNSKIVEFVSPIGNSDVPYPYAIDEEGKHYVFWSHMIVKNVPEKYDDPNDYFCIIDSANEEPLTFTQIHTRI